MDDDINIAKQNYCTIEVINGALIQNQYQKNKTIFLSLSKDSEDKLNTELFSEIFSTQGINNETSSKIQMKIHIETNTKNSIDETKQNQHNNNINPSNTSNKYKGKTEELSIKTNTEENEYINEIGYSLDNTDKEDVPPLIALGVLRDTKEIIPGEKENKIIEEVGLRYQSISKW